MGSKTRRSEASTDGVPAPVKATWKELGRRVSDLYLTVGGPCYGNASAVAKELGINGGTVSRWVTKYGLEEERKKLQKSGISILSASLETMSMELEAVLTTLREGKRPTAADIDGLSKLQAIVTKIKRNAMIVPHARQTFSIFLKEVASTDPGLANTLVAENGPVERALAIIEEKYGVE